MPLSGLVDERRALHHQGMRLDITDDLIDALVDARDDTLLALRAALLRELEEPEQMYVYPGQMVPCGIPVADRHVLEPSDAPGSRRRAPDSSG
jgi:hypothetical protein